MTVGTDAQMFEEEKGSREKTTGRPRVNRDLAEQLIRAKYSTRYIRRVLKCSAKTVRRIRQELEKEGKLEPLPKTLELDKIALELDDECVRAVGISFYEWLKTKRSDYKNVFSFTRKVWTQIWEKPSLVLVKDSTNPLGDQICMKFLSVFGEDKKRLRRRKKVIRQIFRFLARMDLNDRYLTMTLAREPEEVREIPELTLMEFPQKLMRAFGTVGRRMGEQAQIALMFKLCTMMRTGKGEKELMGITVGEPNGSYLLMASADEFRGEIVAKRNEKWVLEWLPDIVRHRLYSVYLKRKRGDKLFSFKIATLLKVFKDACVEEGLPPMKLHDLRKVAITWFWVMGIPIEIAIELNVGWKDLNTVKKHYLRMKELLKKSDRLKYRAQIPEWFKEGLEEYLPY